MYRYYFGNLKKFMLIIVIVYLLLSKYNTYIFLNDKKLNYLLVYQYIIMGITPQSVIYYYVKKQ